MAIEERSESVRVSAGSVRNKEDPVRRSILNDPLLPLMIKMSLPTMVGMVIMVLYNLTDTFFVGFFHQRAMTAAIGVGFSFLGLIQAVGFLFGYGSGNAMSQKLGAHDDRLAADLCYTGIGCALIGGVLMVLVLFPRLRAAVQFIGGGASAEVLQYTLQYLRVMVVAIPFSLYALTIYNQLRLCGHVKDGMAGLLCGMACNMVLDPLFMFFFRWGFVGAAYATLAGQMIGCLALTLSAKRRGFFLPGLRGGGAGRSGSMPCSQEGCPIF